MSALAFERLASEYGHETATSMLSMMAGKSLMTEPTEFTVVQAKRFLQRVDLFRDMQMVLEAIKQFPNLLRFMGVPPSLPSWWEPGVHDIDLVIGTGRHGFGSWETICRDTSLNFHRVAVSRDPSLLYSAVQQTTDSFHSPNQHQQQHQHQSNEDGGGGDDDECTVIAVSGPSDNHTFHPSKEEDVQHDPKIVLQTSHVASSSFALSSNSGAATLAIPPSMQFMTVLDFPKDKILLKRLETIVKTAKEQYLILRNPHPPATLPSFRGRGRKKQLLLKDSLKLPPISIGNDDDDDEEDDDDDDNEEEEDSDAHTPPLDGKGKNSHKTSFARSAREGVDRVTGRKRLRTESTDAVLINVNPDEYEEINEEDDDDHEDVDDDEDDDDTSSGTCSSRSPSPMRKRRKYGPRAGAAAAGGGGGRGRGRGRGVTLASYWRRREPQQSHSTSSSSSSSSLSVFSLLNSDPLPPSHPSSSSSSSSSSFPSSSSSPAALLASPAPPRRVRGPGSSKKSKPKSYFEIETDERGYPLEYPIDLGRFKLHNIGFIKTDNENYHNNKYIWPVNYRISRMYRSMKNPNNLCEYFCEILENPDGTPLFRITPSDDPKNPVDAGNSSAAWNFVLNKVASARHPDLKKICNTVSGPEHFGLTDGTVTKLLCGLPGIEKCEKYEPPLFEPQPRERKITRRHRMAPIMIDDDDTDEEAHRKMDIKSLID